MDEDSNQGEKLNSGTNKKLVLAAMICAVAMTFIDQTIVSIAIPDLQKDLKLGESGAQWIVNGYLVALAALFLFGGRIADIRGHKQMVMVGIVIFTFASAMCGATPTGSISEAWIIFFRVVQGAGAAIMFPAALAIVVDAFPVEERGKAMAAFFGIAGGLTAVGPLAGGFLIEISWRTIFWINVPVAIVAVLLTLKANPEQRAAPGQARLPGRGACGDRPRAARARAPAGQRLGLGQSRDDRLHHRRPGGDRALRPHRAADRPAADAGADLPELGVRRRQPRPPADLDRLRADVPVREHVLARSRSDSRASEAGGYLGIFFGGFVIASQWGGRMLDAIGAKRPVMIGCAVAAVGYYLWAKSMPDTDPGSWNQWWRIVIAGAGSGFVLGPITTDALNRASQTSYGEVTGITQTARNVGASLGIAILGTILISENRSNIESAFEKLGASKEQADAVANSITQSGGGEASGAISSGGAKAQDFLAAVQHSFAQSTEVVFYGMAVAMLLGLLVTAIRVPAGKPPQAEITS